MTEQLHFHFSLSCIGEGNGNPLQCSCLENPRDGGAWWAAVYGVAQSRTRLKRFSSSSRHVNREFEYECVLTVNYTYRLLKLPPPEGTIKYEQQILWPDATEKTTMIRCSQIKHHRKWYQLGNISVFKDVYYFTGDIDKMLSCINEF